MSPSFVLRHSYDLRRLTFSLPLQLLPLTSNIPRYWSRFCDWIVCPSKPAPVAATHSRSSSIIAVTALRCRRKASKRASTHRTCRKSSWRRSGWACSFITYSVMVSVEINGSKRLLVISAAGHVSKEEVKQAAEQVHNALQNVAPGLRALTDFRGLESMRSSAASYIAEIMDVLVEKQVASVIRIIPNRGKDIALNILSQFQCARELPITTTVETLVEALDRLTEQNAGLAERN